LCEQEVADLGQLLRPLKKFIQRCDIKGGTFPAEVPGASEATGATPKDKTNVQESNYLSASSPHEDNCMKALNMPPKLPECDKLFIITKEAVLQTAKCVQFFNVLCLNLHGNSLRKIENISACANLKVLILSFNEIHKIEGLSSLHNLERLELGFNLIKRVEGLRGLNALSVLELNNNLLYRLEDVPMLRKHVPGLKKTRCRNI
jgi:hypothetical protein